VLTICDDCRRKRHFTVKKKRIYVKSNFKSMVAFSQRVPEQALLGPGSGGTRRKHRRDRPGIKPQAPSPAKGGGRLGPRPATEKSALMVPSGPSGPPARHLSAECPSAIHNDRHRD